jgi:hypothetical protein
VRENVNEMIQEELKRIEEAEGQVEAKVEVEIQAEIEDHGEEIGDHRGENAEDEDFGTREEQGHFPVEVGRTLGVETEAEVDKERRALVEREQE